MAACAIDQLIACQRALIIALESGNVGAVEAATRDVVRVLALVRREASTADEQGGGFDDALRQAEAARRRVNFLTGRVAQRLERVTRRRGTRIVQTYTNPAKLRQTQIG